MFIDSTPSSADRPCSGAAAACADMPSNVNRADLLEFEVLGLASVSYTHLRAHET